MNRGSCCAACGWIRLFLDVVSGAESSPQSSVQIVPQAPHSQNLAFLPRPTVPSSRFRQYREKLAPTTSSLQTSQPKSSKIISYHLCCVRGTSEAIAHDYAWEQTVITKEADHCFDWALGGDEVEVVCLETRCVCVQCTVYIYVCCGGCQPKRRLLYQSLTLRLSFSISFLSFPFLSFSFRSLFIETR